MCDARTHARATFGQRDRPEPHDRARPGLAHALLTSTRMSLVARCMALALLAAGGGCYGIEVAPGREDPDDPSADAEPAEEPCPPLPPLATRALTTRDTGAP